MLRQLMERDLVRITGRSDDLGRPFLYGTTKRFLQVFGLRNLDELPRADALRNDRPPEGSPEPQPAARRDEELTPNRESNEESEVKLAVTPELAPEDLLNPRIAATFVGAAGLLAQARDDDDLEDEDDDLEDDDDDDDEEEDLEEEEELEEEDELEDDEWEEVDDEDDEEWDEDEDEDDDDWEDDDDEDDDEEDWEEGDEA